MAKAPYEGCIITYEMDSLNGVCSHDVSMDVMKHTGATSVMFIEDCSAEEGGSAAEQKALDAFCSSFPDNIIIFQGGTGIAGSAQLLATYDLFFAGTRFHNVTHLAGESWKNTYLYLNETGAEAMERLELASAGEVMHSLVTPRDDDEARQGRIDCFVRGFAGESDTIEALYKIVCDLRAQGSTGEINAF